MTDDINEVRRLAFEAIRAVRSGELDVDKARAVNDLLRTLVATGRVEIDYLRLNGSSDSPFLEAADGELPNGITGIVRHRLAG